MQLPYRNITVSPPNVGKHKFAYCQLLYRDIHNFIASRQWTPIDTDDQDHWVYGTTWLEMFILFDTCGYRRHASNHVKNIEVAQRAETRRANRKSNHSGSSDGSGQRDAATRPMLHEELQRFKAIVRHIARHDAATEDGNMFRAEKRQRLRRFANLAVAGNYPAIAAYCNTTAEEDATIVECILTQKVGYIPNAVKLIVDSRHPLADGSVPVDKRCYVRIARIAYDHTVRWKRAHAPTCNNEHDQQGGGDVNDLRQHYTSRLLYCKACGTGRETKQMQLRTTLGYRAIYCYACRNYQTCANSKCQCALVWHQCPTHRTDPLVHRSTRGTNTTKKTKSVIQLLPSTRKRPRLQLTSNATVKTKPKPASRHRSKVLNQIPNIAPPNCDMIQRVRLRETTAIENGELARCLKCTLTFDFNQMCQECEGIMCNNCTTYTSCPICHLLTCTTCTAEHPGERCKQHGEEYKDTLVLLTSIDDATRRRRLDALSGDATTDWPTGNAMLDPSRHGTALRLSDRANGLHYTTNEGVATLSSTASTAEICSLGGVLKKQPSHNRLPTSSTNGNDTTKRRRLENDNHAANDTNSGQPTALRLGDQANGHQTPTTNECRDGVQRGAVPCTVTCTDTTTTGESCPLESVLKEQPSHERPLPSATDTHRAAKTRPVRASSEGGGKSQPSTRACTTPQPASIFRTTLPPHHFKRELRFENDAIGRILKNRRVHEPDASSSSNRLKEVETSDVGSSSSSAVCPTSSSSGSNLLQPMSVIQTSANSSEALHQMSNSRGRRAGAKPASLLLPPPKRAKPAHTTASNEAAVARLLQDI